MVCPLAIFSIIDESVMKSPTLNPAGNVPLTTSEIRYSAIPSIQAEYPK
jgi:hypothetical protein